MTTAPLLEVLPLSGATSEQVQEFLRGNAGKQVRERGVLYLSTPYWQVQLSAHDYLVKVRGVLQRPVSGRALVATYGRFL